MENEDAKVPLGDEEIVNHEHPIPPDELNRYSVDRDLHAEMDIATYVEIQAQEEKVQHVERIKREIVLGEVYDIWDVTTDKDRWWVVTNFTNLYSQKHFPSLDYTLSFHIGLMMRLRSRSSSVDAETPTHFEEVFRRADQAQEKHDSAIEAEDYQAVGMLLRENLISLVGALRLSTELPEELERPLDSNFIGWTDALMNLLCNGSSNRELRQHLKNTAKETWQLANWLTHSRSANKTASLIAIHSCQTTIGNFMQVLDRSKEERIDQCPVCSSRNVREHFDIAIPPDGVYYRSCGVCGWTNRPGVPEE